MSVATALWLFDLGNTSLKGRWSRAGEPGQTAVWDWNTQDLADKLPNMLMAWPRPARVLVASVVSDECAGCLRRALQGVPSLDVQWLTSPRQGCGIVNAYRRPERLGIDRFLAMAGARALSHGAPMAVIGCGTALTLDAVDVDGRQREGLIAPSPALMLRSLQHGTAIAEANPDAFQPDAGASLDDTHRAIQAGCLGAAVALVESFHMGHERAFGKAALWLHGGGAPELHAALVAQGRVPAQLGEDLVWRGLEIWAAPQRRTDAGA